MSIFSWVNGTLLINSKKNFGPSFWVPNFNMKNYILSFFELSLFFLPLARQTKSKPKDSKFWLSGHQKKKKWQWKKTQAVIFGLSQKFGKKGTFSLESEIFTFKFTNFRHKPMKLCLIMKFRLDKRWPRRFFSIVFIFEKSKFLYE